MKPRKPLNDKELCVMQEMILRTGIVYRPDVRFIADRCDMEFTEVLALVNSHNETGRDINRRVDAAISQVPIGSTHRQMAYAQVILDDKLTRRKADDYALSDKDPLEILEFARRVANPSGNVQINVQNNTFAEPELFDFSEMPAEDLKVLIDKLQNAIESGDIIDAEFTELISTDAVPALPGRTSDISTEDSSES